MTIEEFVNRLDDGIAALERIAVALEREVVINVEPPLQATESAETSDV